VNDCIGNVARVSVIMKTPTTHYLGATILLGNELASIVRLGVCRSRVSTGCTIPRSLDPRLDAFTSRTAVRRERESAQEPVRVDSKVVCKRELVAEENEKEEKHASHEDDVSAYVHDNLAIRREIGLGDRGSVDTRFTARIENQQKADEV